MVSDPPAVELPLSGLMVSAAPELLDSAGGVTIVSLPVSAAVLEPLSPSSAGSSGHPLRETAAKTSDARRIVCMDARFVMISLLSAQR